MSIKGLTDRNLAFPEIGQIRKGAQKSENAPGKDLTYFRVEFDQKETKAAQTFEAKYGKEPTEINILLPFNEIERMWDAWLEAYTAGRMVARADGEKYLYRLDQNNHVMCKNGAPVIPYIEGEIVATYVNRKTNKTENVTCKPVGRLKVIVPELARLAYLTVITTSIHDIANISAQLEALKHINGGQLAGIPLILRRRPKKISTPASDGSRKHYLKAMLSIEADPEWVKAKLLEVKSLALPGNGVALLPETTSQPAEEAPKAEAPIPHEDDDWEPPSEPVTEGEYAEPSETPKEVHTEPEETTPRPTEPAPEPPISVSVKAYITHTAKDREHQTISDGKRGLVAPMIEKCFAAGNAASKRHQVQLYLTGKSSIREIPDNYLIALYLWLNPSKDSGGDWIPSAQAARDANAIIAELDKANGAQAGLFQDADKEAQNGVS